MEEENTFNNTDKKFSPVPAGLPINWGLITGPVPEPVFSASSFNTSLPPQSSAVHALQTKVKSLTQRKTRGRDREKERERLSPSEQSPSEVFMRHRAREREQLSVPAPSWQSGVKKHLSSSDEEEEVEVQVRLQIHSPPVDVQIEHQEQDDENEKFDKNEHQSGCQQGRSRGFKKSASLESLLSDNSRRKDNPSPPPPSTLLSSSSASNNSASTSSLSSAKHWAPPKGFWRIARPETLLLSGVAPDNISSSLPLKDYTQVEERTEPRRKLEQPESSSRKEARSGLDDINASSELKQTGSEECHLDRWKQRESDLAEPVKELCNSDSWESITSLPSQSGVLCADLKLRVKERAYAKLRERQQNCREEQDQCEGESVGYCGDISYRVDYKVSGSHSVLDNTNTAFLAQELEPYLRSLLVIGDELPLSPRHEEAKRLLERARLKARSSHIKGDRPRRSHSDQRSSVKKHHSESSCPTTVQKAVQTKEDLSTQTVSGPFLVPLRRETSPTDQTGRPRRHGCSPTRVRFEDESEKEAESRYLDRVKQRERPGMPKFKSKESNTDSSSSGSERSRGHRSVSMPPPPKQNEVSKSEETATVVKEIIVLVKKCEACGSVVREQQPASTLDPQSSEPQQAGSTEDIRGKATPRWVPLNKPDTSTRPKASLTVTFAGAYVLGENKETSSGWKSSGFGKLRRRSRKGESRLESGHGPYGPSWAQRRNSNPRNRVNLCRTVSFAPGSPITLEPHSQPPSGEPRESPTPSLPIKSALKSSSRNRSAAGQSSVQFQMSSSQGDGGSPPLLDSSETSASLSQGGTASSNQVPCARPTTLRYSPARIPADLPSADLWETTPDAAGLSGDSGFGLDSRSVRGPGLSRAEDLRAELLRAEHLKAEALWEENSDGSRKLDGRPKLFLRRFFSSIGLNSVGRLVKGGRSSSMEQLSIPSAPRANSASPSPTRRPQPSIRIQRTPSLQTLHTVLPLAQLRKASSVQSLERRTERSTILGEVQIPYGLAPSPDSPQLELHRTLSVEDVLVTRIVRPLGRVTQAFPDGSLLLELIKPPNGPFGFVISRGKGRPDTGVYVEKVGDGSGEGPYVGLLGVGDEILQVNGEAVAGLSLDQVTRLMTRDSTASLRILPARRNQR